MKKLSTIFLSMILSVGLLASCAAEPADSAQPAPSDTQSSTEEEAATGGVELQVVTSYGGEDGNRANFEEAVAAYEQSSGNTVLDGSATANEEWKARVMADFETGAEPDVLFYFTGADANTLIEGGKLVSLDTIRAEYPEYAANMKDDLLPTSPADGNKYAIPVNGFWEGLYVNKVVLEAAGVDIPGPDYTWDQFLEDSQKIKDAGYTPIAASLQEVPHYWFEFTVFNQGTVANHLEVPQASTDEAGQRWVAGLNDIKELYERGFFPANTLTSTDAEAVQLMADNEAAFLIDGSWKIGYFMSEANVDDFTVTYVPGKNDRAATDIIGGLSMGYYITEKAWNDPEKRDAAVKFVMAMTTDEVVSKFGPTAVTALTNGTIPSDNLSSLEVDAIAMTAGATGVVGATQDGLNAEARGDLFAKVQDIATGTMTAEEALDSALTLK